MFFQEKCISCGLCAEICTNNCHTFTSKAHRFNPEHCTSCGQCAQYCPTQALTVAGQIMTAADVIGTLKKDAAYYNNGGGITLSGGEPLFQPEFTLEILRLAKEQNWHTAVETSGFAEWNIIAALLPFVDLWLYDLKMVDPVRHQMTTGADNRLIIENLYSLNQHGAVIELRTPLIPGINDSNDDIHQLVWLAERLQHVTGIHPEPYHPFGQDKLIRLGHKLTPFTPSFPVPGEADLKRYKEILGRLYLA